MRTVVALAAVAAASLAAPAVAQDVPEAAPFSGAYAGGSIGYDVQSNDVGEGLQFDRNLDGRFDNAVTTGTGANAFSPGFCNGAATSSANVACRNDRDDLSYAARVGFDQQYGSAVIGLVGEFGKSQIRDSVSGFSTTPASYTFTRELDWVAAIRGRAGYARNTTLFYGTAGVAYARIDNSFSTSNTQNAFTGRGSSTEWGFQGGGGIEQKLGRNFSIGLEYLYNRFNKDDYNVRVTQGTALATNPFVLAPNTAGTDIRRSDPRFQWHSVRAVAAFRF